jgi:hypothetical protein
MIHTKTSIKINLYEENTTKAKAIKLESFATPELATEEQK